MGGICWRRWDGSPAQSILASAWSCSPLPGRAHRQVALRAALFPVRMASHSIGLCVAVLDRDPASLGGADNIGAGRAAKLCSLCRSARRDDENGWVRLHLSRDCFIVRGAIFGVHLGLADYLLIALVSVLGSAATLE